MDAIYLSVAITNCLMQGIFPSWKCTAIAQDATDLHGNKSQLDMRLGQRKKIRKPQTFRSHGKGAQKSFGISILEDI